MRPTLGSWLLAVCLLGTWPGAGSAQPAPAAGSLKVFLDCDGECDSSFLRLEINYVNWVLDRADADVHVLVTSQQTGGGGRAATLKFIGLKGFQGLEDELPHTTNTTQSSDDRRRGMAQVLKLGLIRYLARTRDADKLVISVPAAAQAAAEGQGLKPIDRWKNWVFTVSASTFLNGESQQKFSDLSGSVEAAKVLDEWKFSLEVSGSQNRSSFMVPDPEDETKLTKLTDKTSYYALESFFARSLGDHWSAGAGVGAFQSTRSNYDLSLRVGPSLEYNFFKYSESTRKRFTALYQLNVVHADYTAPTLFDRIQEVKVQQSLGVGGRARQPWGDVSGSLTGTAYLDDFSKNQLTLFASLNLRITKGLDFNLFGSYSRIRDQINIPAEGASRDDILRRLRELETGYRYFASFGLSYRFGSIYNNVVNPRFSSRGGGGGRFFRF